MKERNYLFLSIIILVLLIGNSLYYYYKNKNENYENNDENYNDNINENNDNTSENWFISFGGPSQNYLDAVARITRDYGKLAIDGKKLFDHVIEYTDKDIKEDPEFWEKHGNFVQNTEGSFFGGYGHWIWKPYVILKTMKKMKENDILLYLDAGCDIGNDKDNAEKMMALIEKCKILDMLYTSSGHPVKKYTKMDLIVFMNMDDPNILNSIQKQAGILFIKKNNHTFNMIKEWYNIGSIHHLIDDTGSVQEKHPEYEDSRNDQAIFNLLTIKYGYSDKNIIEDISPIIVARRRGG
jgi:hypothetical protein